MTGAWRGGGGVSSSRREVPRGKGDRDRRPSLGLRLGGVIERKPCQVLRRGGENEREGERDMDQLTERVELLPRLRSLSLPLPF